MLCEPLSQLLPLLVCSIQDNFRKLLVSLISLEIKSPWLVFEMKMKSFNICIKYICKKKKKKKNPRVNRQVEILQDCYRHNDICFLLQLMSPNMMCHFVLCNYLLLISISCYKSVLNAFFFPLIILEILCSYIFMPIAIKVTIFCCIKNF